MWEVWLSLATVFLSCVAIGINIYQNRETKKQNLFDRRLRLYLELVELLELLKKSEKLLNDLDPTSVEGVFENITNSSNLYSLADIMINPLESKKKVKFLTSCENMKKDAQEFRFIFRANQYHKLADFIEAYAEMLKKFHQQQVLIKNLERQNEISLHRKNKPLELDYIDTECNKLAQKKMDYFLQYKM